MSAAAAIPAPASIFREDQLFAWWTYALLASLVVASLAMLSARPDVAAGPRDFRSVAIVAGLALPGVFTLGVLKMTTEVAPGLLRVTFGFVPTFHRLIDLGAVVGVAVVSYRPVRDCHGWGVRLGRDGESVLNARGDRGVRLTMRDGSRLLLGSQRPEELARAIEAASGRLP